MQTVVSQKRDLQLLAERQRAEIKVLKIRIDELTCAINDACCILPLRKTADAPSPNLPPDADNLREFNLAVADLVERHNRLVAELGDLADGLRGNAMVMEDLAKRSG